MTESGQWGLTAILIQVFPTRSTLPSHTPTATNTTACLRTRLFKGLVSLKSHLRKRLHQPTWPSINQPIWSKCNFQGKMTPAVFFSFPYSNCLTQNQIIFPVPCTYTCTYNKKAGHSPPGGDWLPGFLSGSARLVLGLGASPPGGGAKMGVCGPRWRIVAGAEGAGCFWACLDFMKEM